MAFLAWTVESNQAKGFVIADPSVAVTMIQKARTDVPVLHVTYNLEDLQKISTFLTFMKQRNIKPQVFLINEQGTHPEVLILFKVFDVPRREVRRAFSDSDLNTDLRWGTSIELLTTAATNVEGYVLRRFLGNFSRCNEAYVIVSEKETEVAATGPVDPIQSFVVKGFDRQLPGVRMY